MKKFAAQVVDFLKEEDGPTAVEYAVMLALIVVVCITAVGSVGQRVDQTFQDVVSELNAAPGGGGD